jgi:hypothetical protein
MGWFLDIDTLTTTQDHGGRGIAYVVHFSVPTVWHGERYRVNIF